MGCEFRALHSVALFCLIEGLCLRSSDKVFMNVVVSKISSHMPQGYTSSSCTVQISGSGSLEVLRRFMVYIKAAWCRLQS